MSFKSKMKYIWLPNWKMDVDGCYYNTEWTATLHFLNEDTGKWEAVETEDFPSELDQDRILKETRPQSMT